jgi:hypothetical protein
MTTRERLLRELQEAPEQVIEELAEYLRLVKTKAARERFDTARASEAVLGRDWLRPEEEAAWKDL